MTQPQSSDGVLAKILVEKTYLNEAQLEECQTAYRQACNLGMKATFLKFIQDRGHVSEQQTLEIRKELVRRGIYPTLGEYTILKKLGEGGTGTVYKAHHPRLDTDVAIKVLAPEIARDKEHVARFKREARTAAKIRQANIVQVLDVQQADGRYFIVMEYVEGESVEQRIRRLGKLPEDEALRITSQTAQALCVAHREGIIHRDVKPSNILLDRDGRARLSDLGLSKDAGSQETSLTASGRIMGTPHYGSPEQCRDSKRVDRRSDIYSLGASLFHMVTGVTPHEGVTSYEVILKHISSPLRDPRELNPKLSPDTAIMIRRMMEKDPEKRIQTCEEIVREAERIYAALPKTAPADAPPAKTPPAGKAAAAADASLAKTRITTPRAPSPGAPVPPEAIELEEPAPVESATSPATAAAVSGPTAPAPAAGQARRKKTLAKAAAAVLAITILGMVGWLVIRPGHSAPAPAPDAASPALGDPSTHPQPLPTEARAPATGSIGAASPPDVIPSNLAKTLQLDCGSGVAMKLLLIPAGSFMMGADETADEVARKCVGDRVQPSWFLNEQPQHRVQIAKPFYMSAYLVTQAQYQAVVGVNPSEFKGPNNPVERVSWYDAVDFCKRLGTQVGRTVRLPTEAEWEYACRAGTTTPFSTGWTISTDQANYNGDFIYGDGKKGERRGKTTPVGTFPPNPLGLYDMHGNLWEWCSSLHKPYPYKADDGRENMTDASERVLRGGAWSFTPKDVRSAIRVMSEPKMLNSTIGFRVVAEAAP